MSTCAVVWSILAGVCCGVPLGFSIAVFGFKKLEGELWRRIKPGESA
jgi:hypothetical protein